MADMTIKEDGPLFVILNGAIVEWRISKIYFPLLKGERRGLVRIIHTKSHCEPKARAWQSDEGGRRISRDCFAIARNDFVGLLRPAHW